MKKSRILSALLVLLMLCSTSAVWAESKVSGFAVEWTGEGNTLTAIATWTFEGEPYEMAITGMKKQLPTAKLAQIAEMFHGKEEFSLSYTTLTDAEKFTHMIPHRTGAADTWVVMDEIRSGESWGDSLQCWAASASNMLASTGWSQKATDPATGKTFTGEDAVFSFFTKCYINDGNYQDEAIRRFFEGNELPGKDGISSDALIPGENPDKYMSHVMISEQDDKGLSIFSGMAGEIRKGAALGISVDICNREYKLKANPDVSVTRENGRYIEYKFVMLDKDAYLDLPEHYCSFDDAGGVVLLTKEGDAYKDKDGNTVPAMSVKKEHLYYVEDTGAYLVPEPDKNGDMYSVDIKIAHPETEVDTDHPTIYAGVGNGSHAITVAGYIKNASAEDGGIRALFIADSDNDANVWKIDEHTTKKEDRPNTYKLCYAEKKNLEGITTLNMTNYVEDGETYVAYACLLYPKGAEPGPVPVPETGDASPIGLFGLACAASGLGLFAMLKRSTQA